MQVHVLHSFFFFFIYLTMPKNALKCTILTVRHIYNTEDTAQSIAALYCKGSFYTIELL